MGLFMRDDEYDESRRMVGFRRYQQLLSFYAGHWTVLGLIVFVSSLPLIAAIVFAILSTSVLILIPGSFVGGMIMAPFLAALIDSIQRGLRDDSGRRWDNYRKGLRQNVRCSLVPGGILGVFVGTYVFLFYLQIYTDLLVLSKATFVLLLVAAILMLIFQNLYWPQMVLFVQPQRTTFVNILLFSSKYLWKVLKVVLIELALIAFVVVFAPYTLILVPVLMSWYLPFLSQYMIYDQLNQELEIEDKFLW